MYRKFSVIILLFVVAAAAVLPVFADEYDVHKVLGSWKLDRVYENASSDAPVELDPENAGSLYAQSENVYVFSADGTAEMTMEEITMTDPARLIKDQPRSQVARRTFTAEGT